MARFLQRYGKPLFATLIAALITFRTLYGDNHIDPAEGVAILLSFANGAVVYLVPLFPGYRWLKSAVGVIIAMLTALSVVILGGLTADEVALVVMAAAQALGIVAMPAVSDTGVGVGPGTFSGSGGYGLGDRPMR